MDAGCKSTVQKISCSYKGCRNKEILKLRCEHCRKQFCVAHREHGCVFSDAKPTKSNNSNNSSTSGKTGGGDSSSFAAQMSERVRNLMKNLHSKKKKNPQQQKMVMKQQAKGDPKLDLEKRFYVEVHFPYDSKVKPMWVYLNKNFSVGKSVDIICDLGKITNRNDKPGQPKLYLFDLATGEKLSNLVVLRNLKSGEMVWLLETDEGIMK